MPGVDTYDVDIASLMTNPPSTITFIVTDQDPEVEPVTVTVNIEQISAMSPNLNVIKIDMKDFTDLNPTIDFINLRFNNGKKVDGDPAKMIVRLPQIWTMGKQRLDYHPISRRIDGTVIEIDGFVVSHPDLKIPTFIIDFGDVITSEEGVTGN